jgi:hypothetical protein
MKYFLIPFFIFILCSNNSIAQYNIPGDTIKKVVLKTIPKKIRIRKPNPISQEFGMGLRINTDGWCIGMHRGFLKLEEPYKTSFVWIDIAEKRHPKEYKQTNQNFATFNPNEPKPLPYKYGKINNFYQFKMGFGIKKPFTFRLDRKSIELNYVVGGGISIGLLKPYYLQLFTDTNSNISPVDFEKYSEANARRFLNLTSRQTIIGSADFTKGLSEFEFKPGLHAKAGIQFDYLFTTKSYMSVELGTSVEMYGSKIPIMATVNSSPFFINLYAEVSIGKRWAKPHKENIYVEEF